MRRVLLWFLTTVSTVVLLFGYRTSTSSALPEPATDTATPNTAAGTAAGTATGTTATGSTATGSTATSSAPATGTGTTASTYTGTVTGTTSSTRWGPVQVRATIANGTITAVDVLQQPTGNRKDVAINAEALPTLVQETLQAQSAEIDMVSGATVTSEGYVESLQSVLDQAGIA